MWQVSITAPSVVEEAVVQFLEASLQTAAAAYVDVDSGKTTVTVYPSSLPCSPSSLRTELRGGLAHFSGHRLAITVKKLPRRNWAESWKRHFKAIEIGRALLIKPGWSKRRPLPGQRVVWLDPGLSFGTGHHATTEFCLARLAACRRPKERQSFLDIGSGSGILAIAAAKLGYSPVDAFDFDPEAVRVSRQNARRNRVQDRVHPHQQDLAKLPQRSWRQWDVICANLTADLHLAQAEKICARLKPGGQLIVAGILRSEFAQICHKFVTLQLTLVKTRAINTWQSGQFTSAA